MSFAAIGAIFAGFRVEKVIGSGATGDVYMASDPGSGDRVALKVPRADLTEDERFRQRFEREAAIATNLDDPGVVRTIAAGEADGRLYLAMEYVAGFGYERRIKQIRETIRRDWSALRQVEGARIRRGLHLPYGKQAHRLGGGLTPEVPPPIEPKPKT